MIGSFYLGLVVRVASGYHKPRHESVKEHANERLAFASPETECGRMLCRELKSKTTLGNGYLGSRIDEERSEMRYLV